MESGIEVNLRNYWALRKLVSLKKAANFLYFLTTFLNLALKFSKFFRKFQNFTNKFCNFSKIFQNFNFKFKYSIRKSHQHPASINKKIFTEKKITIEIIHTPPSQPRIAHISSNTLYLMKHYSNLETVMIKSINHTRN